MRYTNVIFIAVAFLVSSIVAEDPWTPSPLCPFPSEDLTRFPYEGDCSKYWECYEGARYPMDCPAGLEFNDEKHRCDTPSLANCNPDATIIYPTFPHSTVSTASTEPTEPTADPGPVPDCPFPSDDLVFFPVVNNCSQYWECFQGNRYLMSCPKGLYWNELANYCDFPINVDCKATTLSPTPTTASTSSTETTPTGTTDPTATTPTTDPSATTPTTDPTDSTPSPTTEPSTEPTTVNTICQNEPDGTYLPNPTDCSKFYECAGGRAAEEQCSGNLLWNDLAKTCDYPQNVDCSV